jgi:hypothetical protein
LAAALPPPNVKGASAGLATALPPPNAKGASAGLEGAAAGKENPGMSFLPAAGVGAGVAAEGMCPAPAAKGLAASEAAALNTNVVLAGGAALAPPNVNGAAPFFSVPNDGGLAASVLAVPPNKGGLVTSEGAVVDENMGLGASAIGAGAAAG